LQICVHSPIILKLMQRHIPYYLSLLFLTLPPAFSPLEAAASTAEAQEHKRIANIDVVMENLSPGASFDTRAVLAKLKTKVGDPFSQITFDGDLKTLASEYDRVEPSVEVYNGEVYIQLKIWPRPTIRSIIWEGNTSFKSKALQKELGIKPKAIYNRQAFNKAFNKVKEYYIKKGYFESQLFYEVKADPKTHEVDIMVHVKEGRSGKIDNIVFKGFTSKEKSQLLAMIYTKKYNLFTSWFTGHGTYNEEALEHDKMTIINLLQEKGYADAKVDIFIREVPAKQKIVIEVVAERGSIFHFGTLSFEGNTLFTDKEIEEAFLARPEGVYSPEKLRKTSEAIKEMYGRKGYIDTSVQYETQLVSDQPIYNVHFKIEEGIQYKIGLVRVFGNVQTGTNVILRESLLIPGETFDSAKLKATQKRLENIGYFKNVNVYAVRTKDDQSLGENYRDIYIEVEETTTGNVSLFFGFSSADDVFGGLDLSENNFNYRGLTRIHQKGLGALRGGGEYAHARVNIGAKQRSYSVAWVTPYFRDTLWRIGFNIDKTHSSLPSKNYDIDTIGGSLFASYPFAPYWTFGTKYRARYSTTHVSHHLDKEEREEVDSSGVISAIGSSVGYDSTDSAIKPHRGLRSVLEAEFAGLGGNFDFFRLALTNSFYTPLWKHGIMKYRADFKFIEPVWMTNKPDDIPLSERFFLGGENSVRGYRAFDLGPHFPDGTPTGGISASVLSVEYLHEILSFLDGFLFADAGAVSLKRFAPGTYRMSYGFGARIDLMNRLPLVLGMGFPVNPDGRSEVRKFFFSMGGQF